MIKAVIFDCFGVLASDSWLLFKQANFDHSSHLLTESEKLNKSFDAGDITFEKFVEEIAKLANRDIQETYVQLDNTPPNQALFDYIARNLKPKYSIGMLSNAGDNWLNEMFTKEQNALFDGVVLSYEIGYPKPDYRAYDAIVKRLGVGPHEAIFLDDQHRYVVGAEEFGMKAIHYTTMEQAITELEQLLHEA